MPEPRVSNKILADVCALVAPGNEATFDDAIALDLRDERAENAKMRAVIAACHKVYIKYYDPELEEALGKYADKMHNG